ncbi:hypothetical protein HUU42_05550 [bacterium]|nr:hypothetical protein [bacterium]
MSYIQIEFKSHRKEYFDNKHNLTIKRGDNVIVQAESGVDLGRVTQTGDQIPSDAAGKELRAVVRLANPDEIERLKTNRADEEKAKEIIRQKINKFALKMKLVDAEYQFDRRRIVFYFTAEKRVDFRALVRDLASEFKTRIELRQIGVRDEAKRMDGYGPCGKRLCCTSHLSEFVPITTDFAKDQGLQLNPSKLTGLCGRLKCCLAYERDFYVNTLSRFPGVGSQVKTAKGPGEIKHLDIIANKVHIKHLNDDEWETLKLEELAHFLGIDLDEIHGGGCGCSSGGNGCNSGKCSTHDKVEAGEIVNPLKDFIEKESFFEDHNFPKPSL